MAIDFRVRCDRVVELVGEYLEGELDAVDTATLEQHLVVCSGCAEYVSQLRSAVRAAAGLRTDEPPPEQALQSALQLFRRSHRDGTR